MPGTLFVVATPIGNLEDLTFRARRVLGEVDLIAAEDTRRTGRLLTHYGINTPVISLHEHNERREAPRMVERLQRGESVALVSDAGTPGISDPGTSLVAMARAAGLTVTPIPGPSAVTAALSVSGFPATPFTFLGFPPSSGKARTVWFERLEALEETVVFFEAPHRIERTLRELQELVTRPILVGREVSKLYEQWVTQPNSMISMDSARGEFVVTVGPKVEAARTNDIDPQSLAMSFDQIRGASALTDDQVETALGAVYGLPPSRVRRLIKEGRIARKQAGLA
jgi:16S rRNA (cytidine1402-2'-O)-methyltransferase